MKGYPMLTPYQFASNTPILAVDLDGLEATISTSNNTYFVRLKNVNFSFVFRQSNQYFTEATVNFATGQDFSINTQMFDYADGTKYFFAKTPQPNTDYTPQGFSILEGKIKSGRSSKPTFYFSQNDACEWSCGQGDVPSNSHFGFGGGTPIIVNGLKYGEKNIYSKDAPKGLPQVGDPGLENRKHLLQRSNGVYADQNEKNVGKTILGYNSKKDSWIIVSQENGDKGFTLDEIRDKLYNEGYDNVLGFDGSTSSTLVQDGKVLVSPDKRKNSTMPSGVNLNVPDK
jgi:hypothetical protein